MKNRKAVAVFVDVKFSECKRELIFEADWEDDPFLGYLSYKGKNKKRPTIKGVVPTEIRKQGAAAILLYVKKEVERARSIRESFEKFGKNPNVFVSVKHKGVLLEGRVVAANPGWLKVRLEKPEKYGGERGLNFSFGPGVFERGDEPKLSQEGMEGAQEVLARIYDEKKHAEDNAGVIELAKQLNKKCRAKRPSKKRCKG